MAPSPDEIPTRTQLLTIVGVTSVLLLTIAKLWQSLGNVSLLPVRVTPNAIALGLGIAVAIAATSSLIYRLWPAYRRSAEYYLKLILDPLILPDILWVGLLPGLSEELLFRGVMIPALGSGVWAIALSSLCFGALHLGDAQQWPYAVWAAIVGAILGATAVATGNLFIPVVAHIGTNWVSSFLWKTGDRSPT